MTEHGVAHASWVSDERVCEAGEELEVEMFGIFEGGVCKSAERPVYL